MNENKKKSIDNLVNELKSKYNVNSLEGLRQLAKERGIYVIESDEVIIPCASLKNGQKYILLKKDSLIKKFIFGHEIGHHLLDHIRNSKLDEEIEADYFGEQLLSKREPSLGLYVIDALYTIMKNPFLSIGCTFFPFFYKENNLNIIKKL